MRTPRGNGLSKTGLPGALLSAGNGATKSKTIGDATHSQVENKAREGGHSEAKANMHNGENADSPIIASQMPKRIHQTPALVRSTQPFEVSPNTSANSNSERDKSNNVELRPSLHKPFTY
ncbi:hypothetical protein JG688_00016650 [Phytophthora aleatoria]|uniref:Uncharacterized protein n=1 Tax=Phytophthora aleatoria TaxID=2496075 RepID=A0A8J5M1W7_9STRA|nr:hypothetical protein JG688_00016650 [Phytophthora aleatoria]